MKLLRIIPRVFVASLALGACTKKAETPPLPKTVLAPASPSSAAAGGQRAGVANGVPPFDGVTVHVVIATARSDE